MEVPCVFKWVASPIRASLKDELPAAVDIIGSPGATRSGLTRAPVISPVGPKLENKDIAPTVPPKAPIEGSKTV